MKQVKEIGESDWSYCGSNSYFEYCEKSPEHDTRTIAPDGKDIYPGQFESY